MNGVNSNVQATESARILAIVSGQMYYVDIKSEAKSGTDTFYPDILSNRQVTERKTLL